MTTIEFIKTLLPEGFSADEQLNEVVMVTTPNSNRYAFVKSPIRDWVPLRSCAAMPYNDHQEIETLIGAIVKEES